MCQNAHSLTQGYPPGGHHRGLAVCGKPLHVPSHPRGAVPLWGRDGGDDRNAPPAGGAAANPGSVWAGTLGGGGLTSHPGTWHLHRLVTERIRVGIKY